MRNSLVLVASLLAITLLGGCATGPRTGLLSEEQFDLQKSGVAFLSLGRLGVSRMQLFSIRFRNRGMSENEALHFVALPENMFRSSRAVIKTNDRALEVVGHALVPGEYELNGYGASFDTGMHSGEIRSSAKFSIPFKVEAGKATYLGSFNFIQLYGENALGMRVISGGFFAVADELARDRAKLIEVRPELGAIEVILSLPSDEEKTPFPRLKSQ